jgi:hypothetical protein
MDSGSISGAGAFSMNGGSNRLQQASFHLFNPDRMEIGLDEPEQANIRQHFLRKTLILCTQEPVRFFHSGQSRPELTDLFKNWPSDQKCT